MPRQRIDVKRAIEMYTTQHLTMEEIGRIFGVSRIAVHKALRKAGIVSAQGEHVETVCTHCGQPITVLRYHWRKHRRHFCNQACFGASMRRHDAVTSPYGTQKARKLVARYFPLQSAHIVHHIDHNQSNNALSNLAVVASASDHARLHHGADIPFLWDGRTFAK